MGDKKGRKLNYRFHNPNTIEETADYILKLLISVNQPKVEEVIQKYVIKEEEREKEKNCSA